MRNKLYYFVGLMFALIVVSCKPVDLPIAIYFPNKIIQEVTEEKYIEAVHVIDQEIDQVSFYITSIETKEYDLNYDHEVTNLSQYVNNDTIPIYHVFKIFDRGEQYGGFAYSVNSCQRFIAIIPNAPIPIFVHEMGHILGLGHSSDPDNFMYPLIVNENIRITNKQQKKMYRNALKFSSCFD